MEYRRKKVGLFTFGLSLIFVGSAILLNQYSDNPIFKDYYLLWPAFLILLGLEFILTKLYYDLRKEEVHLSPSGLSIFLIIVVIFTSFLWGGIHNSPLNFNFNFGNGFISNNFRHQVTDTYDSGSLTIENLNQVVIKNYWGRIDVKPSDDDTLNIKADINVATNDTEKAEELMDDIINVRQGSTTSIESRNPASSSEMNVEVHFTISVPRNAKVTANTRFGNVWIMNIDNDVEVQQEHADVEIKNIQGQVKVESSFAAVEVSGISKDLEIKNRHGSVRVNDIGGKASIQNEYDNTWVEAVEKDVTIDSRHGEVRVSSIMGNADISNEYNSIECTDIMGNLYIKGHHSRLDIENAQGNIEAETSYEPINLTNGSYDNADINLNTRYDDIISRDVPNLKINTDGNFKDGEARNGDGSQKIRLQNEHGAIKIEAR